MRAHVRLEDFGNKEALKAARKVVRLRYTEAIQQAGEEAVLPLARAASPGIVTKYLRVKSILKGAYLTTVGPRKYDNITGLLNFGGSVRGKLQPKRVRRNGKSGPRALFLKGPNVVVASVGEEGKIRARYKGQHFLEKAISEGVPAMERLALKKVLDAFGAV